jgi:hypothetical protein
VFRREPDGTLRDERGRKVDFLTALRLASRPEVRAFDPYFGHARSDSEVRASEFDEALWQSGI